MVSVSTEKIRGENSLDERHWEELTLSPHSSVWGLVYGTHLLVPKIEGLETIINPKYLSCEILPSNVIYNALYSFINYLRWALVYKLLLIANNYTANSGSCKTRNNVHSYSCNGR